MPPPIPVTASQRRVVRIPQEHVGIRFVCLALGEAHQLELHAPRAEKVHPSLTLAGVSAGRRLTKDPNALSAKVIHSSIDIVDIKRQVVTADVAVTRNGRLAVG